MVYLLLSLYYKFSTESTDKKFSKSVNMQILLEFRDISRVSEAITAKRMKIDPFCQRRNPKPTKCIGLDLLFCDV